jgi:hypothetical protein
MNRSRTSVAASVLACASFLNGCGGTGYAYEKKLTGPYALVAVGVMEQMALVKLDAQGNGSAMVEETVFGAGWTDDWIMVEQHPSQPGQPIDKTRTDFYILRVSDEALKGPFNQKEFEIAKTALEVPKDLTFSVVFKELK